MRRSEFVYTVEPVLATLVLPLLINSKHSKSITFLIPKRALPENSKFCPAWYSDENNNPCRPTPSDAFDCSPREWTRLIWTWDSSIGKCVKNEKGICTSHRGLGFLSEKACDQRCNVNFFNDVCRLPVNKGCNCESKQIPVTRWFYDKTKNTCSSFQYFGCGWNGNNFATYKDCLGRCDVNLQDRVEITVDTVLTDTTKQPLVRNGFINGHLVKLQPNKKVIIPAWIQNYVKLIKIKRNEPLSNEEQEFVDFYDTEYFINHNGDLNQLKYDTSQVLVSNKNSIQRSGIGHLLAKQPFLGIKPPMNTSPDKIQSPPDTNQTPPSPPPPPLGFFDDLPEVETNFSIGKEPEIKLMTDRVNDKFLSKLQKIEEFDEQKYLQESNALLEQEKDLQIIGTSIIDQQKEPKLQPPYCQEPRYQGQGRMDIKRWFYSRKMNKCYQFWYNGGGQTNLGGVNNFKTKTACLDTCVV